MRRKFIVIVRCYNQFSSQQSQNFTCLLLSHFLVIPRLPALYNILCIGAYISVELQISRHVKDNFGLATLRLIVLVAPVFKFSFLISIRYNNLHC